jgi:histidyl-tRNA synthetase
VDAEVILMLIHFLRGVGVADAQLEINSLGCPACRPAFRAAILSFLDGKTAGLCEDCQRRLHTNPLRVLDCKVEGCREILTGAPKLGDFLCPPCGAHQATVQKILEDFGIAYKINPRMVRGLDYYSRTAFEVTTECLGAQNAVAGGGRYDSLVAELGGPNISGIGFAIGIERLISLLPQDQEDFNARPDLFIVALGEAAQAAAFALGNRLRMRGLWAEMDYTGKSLKSQMKRADKFGSRYALILGENEMTEQKAILRNMQDSTQETINFAAWEETLLKTIKAR